MTSFGLDGSVLMKPTDVFLRRCENCEYFKEIYPYDSGDQRKKGTCRINPPVAQYDPEYGEVIFNAFPRVTAGCWCAKFTSATDPAAYFSE